MEGTSPSPPAACGTRSWVPAPQFPSSCLQSSGRLHEIGVPTLHLRSLRRSDSALWAHLQSGIVGSRLEVFQQSAHMAHLEEPEEYARVVREFLSSGAQERAA